MAKKKKILTHDRLGISFAEYGAMLGTRAMLAAKLVKRRDFGKYEPDEHLFDMSRICARTPECGSVSCIGGTMAMIMFSDDDDKAEKYVSWQEGEHTPLSRLFFPKNLSTFLWQFITPKQAIGAIDNFLAGKSQPWTPALLRGLKKKHAV